MFGALTIVGCSYGYGTTLRFEMPRAQYPISMTRGLVDEKGIVDPSRIRSVGRLELATDGCVPESTLDLSQAVNEQVRRAGGDAVTNFELLVRREDRCIEAKLMGEIVKVER